LVEAAGSEFLLVQQLAEALSKCAARDIDCQVKEMAQSPKNPILGFKAWENRIADHDFVLSVWRNGKQERIN